MMLLVALLATNVAVSVPFHASVTAVAVDPSDPNRMYASTIGGVLQSDNRGQTWEQIPVFPAGQRQPRLERVAFDRANPATIYVASTGSSDDPHTGAWRSHDRGAHWERIIQPGTFPEHSNFASLLVAPSNGSVLYAVVSSTGSTSTYRSTNGGDTWSFAGTGRVMAISPQNADTVYRSGTAGTVHRSTNGGQSYSQVGQTWNASSLNGINAISISPTNPNLLMATMSGPTNSQNGIFRSTNGGGTWVRVHTGGNIGVAFNPENSMEVIAGDCCGMRLYYSKDSGVTFVELTRSALNQSPQLSFGQGNTAFDPLEPGVLLHGSTTTAALGVFRLSTSVDGGIWARVEGTYTPMAVPSTSLANAELLSGDTSMLATTVNIVPSEGGVAPGFTISPPAVTGDGISVQMIRDGSDPNNPQPTVSIRRNAAVLEPGSYDLRMDIPVTGAINSEVSINGSLVAVDQPETAGVYIGSAIPAGNFISVYSLAQHNGVLYVGSFTRIFAIHRDGRVETIAGTGTSGYAGDGGPATEAQVSFARSLAIAGDGTMYFHDSSPGVIRRIGTDGIITTVAGSPTGSTTITDDMPASSARFNLSPSLALRANGDLLLSATSRIWLLDGTVLRRVAGGGNIAAAEGVMASQASLTLASNIEVDEQDRISVKLQHQVFRIRQNGTLQHMAGAVGAGTPGSEDAREMALRIDTFTIRDDHVFYVDSTSNTIKRVDPDGRLHEVAFNGLTGTASSCTGARYVPMASTTNYGLHFTEEGTLIVAASGLPQFWIPTASTDPGPSPVVPAEGVVHAASFSRALAPGSLVSIFGSDVAEAQQAASALPLPARLGKAVACVAGRVAPMVFASPLQLNVQVPYGLEPGTHTLRVFNESGGTSRVQIQVQAAAPEIFRQDDRAIVINPDGSLNTPGNGTTAGSVVVAYLTGLGDLEPDVATGAANPLDPLAVPKLAGSATIGSVPAPLHFLGMTPGYAGLAQANIEIPDLPPGEHAVVVSVGAYSSEPLMLTVK